MRREHHTTGKFQVTTVQWDSVDQSGKAAGTKV